MTIEQLPTKCKHWLCLACPERNNSLVRKFQNAFLPTACVTWNEFEELYKLCEKCDKFELKH